MLVDPSASDAEAVISADAPLETSSASVLVSPSESVGVETSNSFTSAIVTDTDCVAALPPASVAVTVTAHGLEAHVIDSKFCPPEDANLSVPEFTSNNAESVPESV